jgi:hypothetical protein
MAIFAILGIFYPKKLQNYYVDYCSGRKYMRPFLGFAKSKLFILEMVSATRCPMAIKGQWICRVINLRGNQNGNYVGQH